MVGDPAGGAAYRLKPEDLEQIFVRSNDRRDGAAQVGRHHQVRRPRPELVHALQQFPGGEDHGQRRRPATARARRSRAMEEIGDEMLPAGLRPAPGPARRCEEKKAGSTSALVFIFGLVMVFLILAAQYEKWTLPIGVLLAVPFALFGALLRDPAARAGERRLLPDRPDDAGRARGEERDPDLRVRGAEPRARARPSTTPRCRRGERAAAPDRDDVARVHPRLRAARDRDRRVGATAAIRSAPA